MSQGWSQKEVKELVGVIGSVASVIALLYMPEFQGLLHSWVGAVILMSAVGAVAFIVTRFLSGFSEPRKFLLLRLSIVILSVGGAFGALELYRTSNDVLRVTEMTSKGSPQEAAPL